MKNVSAPTSSKSVPTKNKELVSKIEEQKSVSSPTTYESPSLMLNGRLASGGKLKVDFKQTILTEEEKKFYNAGGLKVNDIDEIDRDSF